MYITKRIIFVLVVSLLLTACAKPQWQPGEGPEKKPSLSPFATDTDPSTTTDPDDRIAALLLQATGKIPKVVTSTKGNVPATNAFANAQTLWGDQPVEVVKGQNTCNGQMVQHLAHQLKHQPLTLLALGPVTNIATLIRCQPKLRSRITQVIVVAGRKPGEKFWLNEHWKVGRPMHDLNYETDRQAMQHLLSSGVPIVLVPFAAGNAIRIHPGEVRNLPTAELERVRNWASTLFPIGGRGTIPAFDPVATAFMLWPTEFTCQAVSVHAGINLVATKTTRSRIKWCVPSNPKQIHALILSFLHGGNR